MPSWTRSGSRLSCSTGNSAWSPRAARSTRLSGWSPTTRKADCFYELADGQWNIPALRDLLEDVIPKHRTVEAYEIEHDFAIGRPTHDASQRAPGVRRSQSGFRDTAGDRGRHPAPRCRTREGRACYVEKEMLLEEMRHRVANSLQIIASILLLKARTVQSEETRRHLQDAHQRVMSVATVQQQLRERDWTIESRSGRICRSSATAWRSR